MKRWKVYSYLTLGETDFLDFKMKWIDLTKLAKHTLAIANSGGGCILMGGRPERRWHSSSRWHE
ncbi:hypothetical protein LC040_18965 [Bacillus tianshenii]|nr:hypothetical protein LC040_18965 [Bacillus tianshenii]